MSDITPLFERFGRTFEAGEIIFNEGDEASEMFIIQSGNVRVTKNIHNTEYTLADLGKGDFFGEMAIVTRDKRFGTAIALSKIEVLAFSKDDLANLITKNAKIAFNIIDKLCRRLQNTNLNIKNIINSHKRGMIALMLLEIQGNGKNAENITADTVIEKISERLKISDAEINSYLFDFKTDGIIETTEDIITIKNRAKLEKYVENTSLQE
jgi:CRP/FNR family cyclic AMP-dependent transcriptional regulator